MEEYLIEIMAGWLIFVALSVYFLFSQMQVDLDENKPKFCFKYSYFFIRILFGYLFLLFIPVFRK